MKILFLTDIPDRNGRIFPKELVSDRLQSSAENGDAIPGHLVKEIADADDDIVIKNCFVVASAEDHEKGIILEFKFVGLDKPLDFELIPEKLQAEIRGMVFLDSDNKITDLQILTIDVVQRL